MCGIQPSNSLNFSLQNSIKKLTSLPKAGLLDTLSEILGTKVFDKNKNDVQDLIEKSETIEKKINNCLESIKNKLESLQHDKEQFSTYDQQIKKTHK